MTLSPRAQAALAAALYLLLAVLMTWPMPANIGSQVFGAGGGDTWAEIASWREFAERDRLPFVPGVIDDFNAPEGWHYGTAIYVATWSSTIIKWPLFWIAGPVVGWNLWVLLGYVLTAIATFLLARKVTGSARAALVAGLAYAFWPWAMEHGKVHVEFSHGWVFVLLAWRMLELRDRPTVRNGLLAGGAGVVCVSYNPYFLLFGGILFATLAVAGLVASRGRFVQSLKAHSLAGGVLLGAAIFYGLYSRAAGGEATRSYGIEQLVTYGARPLQYLVPHPDTMIFGGATASWWANNTQGAGLTEKALYLGITMLLLAAVALGALVLRRAAAGARANTWTFAAVAVVAAAFSAPPYFQPGGFTIYMPSYFVYEVLPTWRVFSRIGEVVMLGVAMLAAIGLARLMQRRSRRQATAIFAAAAVLVPLDLWTRPDPPTAAIPEPPVYSLLEGERTGILAEYPLMPNTLPEYTWALTQDIHDIPLLNGYTSGSREEARALWLFELGERETAEHLRLLGVTHVMLIENYAPQGVRASQTPSAGFQLLGRTEGRSMWRVTAAPAEGIAWLAQGGGDVVEGGPGSHYMWMLDDRGELDIQADCRSCHGELRFRANSHARPRRMRISDPSGRVLLDTTVRAGEPQPIRVPVSFDRELRLDVSVTPPEEPAGAGDLRSLSVAFVEPKYVDAP